MSSLLGTQHPSVSVAMLALFRPLATRLGWESHDALNPPQERHAAQFLQPLALFNSVLLGDPTVSAKALSRFYTALSMQKGLSGRACFFNLGACRR